MAEESIPPMSESGEKPKRKSKKSDNPDSLPIAEAGDLA